MTSITLTGLLGLAVLAAPPAGSVQFDGETYVPQYRSDQPEFRLVEFVRPTETVENWTKLFAVRHYPRQQDPRTAVAVFEQMLKQRNPLARSQVLVKGGGSEAMIDFLTWADPSDGMEFNIHLYLKQDGLPGLVSYQFAYRIRDPLSLTATELRTMKDHWCQTMREMDLPKVFGK